MNATPRYPGADQDHALTPKYRTSGMPEWMCVCGWRPRLGDNVARAFDRHVLEERRKQEPVCRCEPYAYLGAQHVNEPVRCERCQGLVDDVASERIDKAYAEARERLERQYASWAHKHAVEHPGHRAKEGLDDPGSCDDCLERSPAYDLTKEEG